MPGDLGGVAAHEVLEPATELGRTGAGCEVLPQACEDVARSVVLVIEADPVVRGQTASSSYKPGKLENGRRVMIPPHIGPGTRIVVSTADGSYLERAKD